MIYMIEYTGDVKCTYVTMSTAPGVKNPLTPVMSLSARLVEAHISLGWALIQIEEAIQGGVQSVQQMHVHSKSLACISAVFIGILYYLVLGQRSSNSCMSAKLYVFSAYQFPQSLGALR